MGANKAGLSYGDLLLGGLSSSDTSKLLEGILSYIASDIGGADNNVVKSELSRVFGISISDVKAATNLAEKGALTVSLDDDISSALLDNMDNYSYAVTRL